MAPKRDNFHPGHSVHYIQARKALEDTGSWQAVSLLYVGEGKIAVRLPDAATHWYKCGDFIRFLAAINLEPGRVTEPRQLILVSKWSLLMVPAGGILPAADRAAESAVPAFNLRGGSVTGALMTMPGGSVPMFSIAPSEPVEGVELQPTKSNEVGQSTERQSPSLWVIDGYHVCEPYVGGMVLGQLPHYDVEGFELVHYSQEEFDAMMEEYREEHGHYPDT